MSRANRVYVLRTVDAQRRAHGGFVWPESGPVEAPDWDPTPECGRGLHGLLRGEGAPALLDWSETAIWQVVAVDPSDVVHLGGKIKFPRCIVVYSGTREQATTIVRHRHPDAAVHGVILAGGNRSTLTGGARSTLTGGDSSNLTGGADSNLTGGDYSNLTGGDYSNLTGGVGSNLTGGDSSNLTGGDYSTLTGGYYSTLTGGNRSTLVCKWWDGNRIRITVGYIGEGGLEPGVAYRLDAAGAWQVTS